MPMQKAKRAWPGRPSKVIEEREQHSILLRFGAKVLLLEPQPALIIHLKHLDDQFESQLLKMVRSGWEKATHLSPPVY